jgi:hypothetical protein
MEKWMQHKKSDHSLPSEVTIKNNWCKAVPPVRAIVMSTRRVHLFLYSLCSCEIKENNIIVCEMAKQSIMDHFMTQHYASL